MLSDDAFPPPDADEGCDEGGTRGGRAGRPVGNGKRLGSTLLKYG